MQHVTQRRKISSIYLGGGTPTTLSRRQLNRLFKIIRKRVTPVLPPEVTIEMNPGTASLSKLQLLRQLGATRLSIGAQSFENDLLRVLGRTHEAEETVSTIRAARKTGLPSIGLDLIYGIPGQTNEQWQDTLRTALELGPDHLSVYSLSLDEGTAYEKASRAGILVLPDDDTTALMYETARRSIARAGFEQYEISNFALPDHACRHNQHYWERGEYLGFGPSAWSFVGDRRWMNITDWRAYTARMRAGSSQVEQEETIGPAQAASEHIMLGLRRKEGITLSILRELFAQTNNLVPEERIEELSRRGLVDTHFGRIRLSHRGMLLSNEVMARLIP